MARVSHVRRAAGRDTEPGREGASEMCKHCGEAAQAHCEGCMACPEQECPDWCDGPAQDD